MASFSKTVNVKVTALALNQPYTLLPATQKQETTPTYTLTLQPADANPQITGNITLTNLTTQELDAIQALIPTGQQLVGSTLQIPLTLTATPT